MTSPTLQGSTLAVPPGLPSLEALEALEARLRQDLACLDLPAKPWLPMRLHDGRPVLDVAIVGAGMAGLAAGAALGLIGIRANLFNRSPAGFEGPWPPPRGWIP